MIEKSIEIYYDVPAADGSALDFRNAAMELIEAALMEAQAGEWEGAEIGANYRTGRREVNFGFSVADFDQAEAIARRAVAGTPYANIRAIERRTWTPPPHYLN